MAYAAPGGAANMTPLTGLESRGWETKSSEWLGYGSLLRFTTTRASLGAVYGELIDSR